MPNYVANRVQAGLNKRMMPVNGSSVVILGIAYKKNSNDARETPASGLIRSLHSLGAKISVVDAHVERYALDHLVSRVDAVTPELLQEANVVVIVTDHDDVDYDMVLGALEVRVRLAAPPARVVDGRVPLSARPRAVQHPANQEPAVE